MFDLVGKALSAAGAVYGVTSLMDGNARLAAAVLAASAWVAYRVLSR